MSVNGSIHKHTRASTSTHSSCVMLLQDTSVNLKLNYFLLQPQSTSGLLCNKKSYLCNWLWPQEVTFMCVYIWASYVLFWPLNIWIYLLTFSAIGPLPICQNPSAQRKAIFFCVILGFTVLQCGNRAILYSEEIHLSCKWEQIILVVIKTWTTIIYFG